jgi:protocatechuate 3,4-dioxygenase beta subunit
VGEVALTRSARFSGDVGKVLLTAFFLLVFLGSASGRQQSANNSKNAAPPSGQISGHVYSAATGQPLAKAVVTLEYQGNDGPAHGDIQTGADGSFQFIGVAPGKYQISITRCGYLAHSGSGAGLNDSDPLVELGPSEKREGLSFHLIRGGIISGTVTDEENEPVPGLEVEAVAYPYEPGGGNRATSGVASLVYTDDLGNFRIIDLNSGSYFVVVGDDEPQRPSGGKLLYRTAYFPDAHSVRDAQRVRVTEGTETSGIHVTVKLERAFTVRGHAHGACLGGDEISCSLYASSVGTLATESGRSQSTAEDGIFEIAGLFPGEYSLTAAAMRRVEGEGEHFFGIGNVRIQVLNRDAEAEVFAGPLAEVSGIVEGEAVASTNKPFPQVSLLQVSTPLIQTSRPRVFSGTVPQGGSARSKNHFQITWVEPGAYVFAIAALRAFSVDGPEVQINDDAVPNMDLMYLKEVNCGGHDYAKEAIELGAGAQLDNCTVKIGHDTASINGRVMNGDKGVAGQIVVAIPESPELRRNPRYTLTGRTNHDGQFSITGIIPGDYLIFAVTPNEEQSYYALDFADRNLRDAERATFKPGEAKTFVLKPSSAQ